MTRRNPQNERYIGENHTGVSRKSAASAKPKSKAASSVYIASSKSGKNAAKTKAEKKAAAAKRREQQAKYATPDTPEYKFWRKVWWVLIGSALVIVILAMVLQQSNLVNPTVLTAGTVVSWVLIAMAFVLEFTKIRQARNNAMRMSQKNPNKKNSAERKAAVREARKQHVDVEQSIPEKESFFKKLFGKKKQNEQINDDASKQNQSDTEVSQLVDEAKTEVQTFEKPQIAGAETTTASAQSKE